MSDIKATPLLLDWREKVCASNLRGLPRAIAVGSEVCGLDENGVTLAVKAGSLVDEYMRSSIEESLSAALGRKFAVRIAPREKDPEAVTVGALEENERRKARIAMIEAFRVDPFVQKCVEMFEGTLDETSVRALTQLELKELENHEKHSGAAGSGPEDAEER